MTLWLHPGDRGTAAAELAADYAHCAEVTRSRARNFSYGIRLLPAERRAAMQAIYAFARAVDDVGDGDLPAAEKLDRLARLRAALARVGPEADDPVLRALGDASRRFPIPLDAFAELIDGVELDVHGARFRDFDALVHYCRCVAGSIGRLCLGVFSDAQPTPRAQQLADTLGIALQQTNVLRDIREDLACGRVYLPADDLRRFGVRLQLGPDGRLAGDRTLLASLVAFEAQRAARWYDEGLRLLPLLDGRNRACCAALAGVYRRLLRRIVTDPGAVLDRRLSLPPWEKALVAGQSLAGAAAA